MNRWVQRMWEPDGRHTRMLVKAEYDLLWEEARAQGLCVELRVIDGVFVELGVSDGRCVDLYGLRDLQRASRLLRDYLRSEK